jgi:hypothetical protein
VEIDAGEPERGRNQCRRRLPIGTEAFAVEEELGVELPGPPGGENGVEGRLVHLKQIGYRRLVRGERDDRPDVQVAVRPAVQATPDPRRKRVVDGRMA